MATKDAATFRATDVCGKAVTAWHMALQGVTVRNIVRDTDRVPRLRDEPASGNRSHVWTAAETVMIVDGLTDRGQTRGKDADALIRALGIPTTVRDAARKAYAARTGRDRKATVVRKATKPTGDPLGKRAIRTKPIATPVATDETPAS